MALFRDKLDGSLRGMILVSPDKITHNGQTIIAVKQGLALFKDKFRGGPLFILVSTYFIMMEMLLHPL